MSATAYKAPALGMGLKLINALSEASSPQGLSELARRVGTNKNMATRLLSTLQVEGWVEMLEPGPRYRLTLKPFAILSKTLGAMPLTELAHEPLKELWESCGQSAYLGVLNGVNVMYFMHFDAVGPVKIAGRVGGEYPLHCSAPGKALLAYSDCKLFEYLASRGFKKHGPNSICEASSLSKELERVKANGFATDNEEFGRGIVCVAAPVFDRFGQVAGTAGISATTIDFSLEELVKAHSGKVVACAQKISSSLGFER